LNAGILFLIVGPSGVGKDTLIDGAKAALARDPKFVFPARYITRPFDAGGEQHIEMTPQEFVTAQAEGHYVLSWQAHGLDYGIHRAILEELANGNHVIVNVSRSVLDQARAIFPNLRIVSISAPSDVLASRLRARGRETEADIVDRIKRAESYQVSGRDVVNLVNDRELDIAIAKLVAILKG
jgi:ribose 1,5-bisphosphokinase